MITMCKVKEWMEGLTDVVELTKREYFLTIAASLLGGIIVGFVFAPKRTRHTMIGSNNGPKNSSNKYGRGYCGSWDELEEMDGLDDMEPMDRFKIEDEELSFN